MFLPTCSVRHFVSSSRNGMLLFALITLLGRADHVGAAQYPPWDDLRSTLSSDNVFQIANPTDWFDQCASQFANLPCVNDEDKFGCEVRNFQLFDQPSGLCSAHLKCAYEKCIGGPDVPKTVPAFTYASFNSTMYPKDMWISDDRLDLPAAVVHPIHIGDVSASTKFAQEHKVEVSVKTSGHSYTGSSTKKGTLLLNLFQLKKYSPDGSIIECQIDANIPEGAYQEACNLAIARDKPAVIRVGGGEVWDETLRAVNMVWNENEQNVHKYHIVSGSAGTVSAAGGWLASGGLSGNNGMRKYGLGLDQVLHVEMVLPSGDHVRFGPTEWKKEADMMYPTTTKVSGYCNEGDLANEDSWDWQNCQHSNKDIDFEGLWFAVRGGGGGSYGVITVIYYQLHDQIPIEDVNVDIPNVLLALPSDELKIDFLKMWVEFLLRFFYLPESIGVTETVSHSCSCATSGGFFGGKYSCFYRGAGNVMKNAWTKFLGIDDGIDEYFLVFTDYDSFAHIYREQGKSIPNVPEGRIPDEGPAPGIYPVIRAVNNEYLADFLMFPLDVIVNKIDELIPMIADCALASSCTGSMYIMGGKIPAADDGMNSLPIHRRHGGFLMPIISQDVRTEFKQVFYGVEDGHAYKGGNSFPGELCHNHASPYYPTALKEDWTQGCNPTWSEEEKKEKCYSFHEAAWGTDILVKLQGIHAAVDPNNLFNCWDCVGNAPEIKSKKKKKDKKKKKKQTVMKAVNELYTACEVDDWSLIGDGYCDDEYNNEACGFDGGDCN